MVAMASEVEERARAVEALTLENAGLRARERALARAVQGCDSALRALSAPDAPPAEDDAAAAEGGGGEGGADEDVAAAAAAAAAAGGGSWAAHPPRGDEELERVLAALRDAPAAGAPRDELLAIIARRVRAFVVAYREAHAAEGPGADEARAASLELFRLLHGHMRHALAACPLLRVALRTLNLDTLAREAPPHGHWARVVAACDPAANVAPDALREIAAMLALRDERVARLRARQAALCEELRALGDDGAAAAAAAASGGATSSGATSGGCDTSGGDSSGGGRSGSDAGASAGGFAHAAAVEQLLRELQASQQAELTETGALLWWVTPPFFAGEARGVEGECRSKQQDSWSSFLWN